MATTTTPNLGLTLAVPGSNEPFDTAVVNANFEAIDDEVGSQRADTSATDTRLDTIEKFTNPSVPSPTMGVIPAGTAAQRDGLYGVPATAADRVALANKGARWFNMDKGYEQQYFAASTDAGVTASTPVRNGAGWRPAQHLALVPVMATSVTAGSGTAVKKGTIVEFGGVSALSLNQVFDHSQFQDYLIRLHAVPAAGTPDLRLRLRNGTTDAAGAGTYGWQNLVQANTTIAGSESASDTSWLSNRLNGTFSDTEITLALRPSVTSFMSRGADPAQQRFNSGYRATDATAYDGITLSLTASTMTGYLTVFGYNSLI